MITKKISIIIPVYRVETCLNKCVQSIVDQTYNNLEIILVDDGSPDNCPQMCDEWAKKDKRIKVIHKTNGGVSSARNSGLDNATGEYIMFCDSDDWYEPQMCDTMIKFADEKVLPICGHMNVYKHKAIKKYASKKICYLGKEKFDTIVDCDCFMCLWNKIYKKKLLNGIRFDTELCLSEDFLFNIMYLKKCNRIVLLPMILYNYSCLNNNSLSRKYTTDSFDMHIKSLKLCTNNISNPHKMYNHYLLKYLVNDLLMLKKDSLMTKKEKRYEMKRLCSNVELNNLKYKLLKNAKHRIFYILLKMKMYKTIWSFII